MIDIFCLPNYGAIRLIVVLAIDLGDLTALTGNEDFDDFSGFAHILNRGTAFPAFLGNFSSLATIGILQFPQRLGRDRKRILRLWLVS